MEVTGGVVTVAPSAAPPHHFIAGDLHKALHRAVPAEWGIHQWLPLAVPSHGGMYLPDVLVVPGKGPRIGGSRAPAAHAELAVEITSRSDARHERVIKRDAYAAAGIPLYLLVDRFAPGGPTVTLYGEPRDGAYSVLAETAFGAAVELPAPFEVTISTDDWPTP
ncbi:Uma2 family endonuclease [Streptomyces sp. NPDC046939]|uniref:Uma2 family endonuclease n=1 Tax=Streptomyces sp. NPDC046939 TaxID=3155376 RepID=UPI0033EF3ED0